MKNMFSRYFGKVVAVIKQDGLFGGIKKILKAAYFMLRPVGSGDVLFISSGVVGDSMRYRVRNVAEELKWQGFKCGITIQENPLLFLYANRFKIFIFHRVSVTPGISEFIEEIKKQGKEIIFETDDLLFDPELVKQQDFFMNSNELEKKFYENGVGAEFLADPYVTVCSTTTNFLAEKLRERNKLVYLVPNKLSESDVDVADKITKHKEKRSMSHAPSSMIKIGYFSGAFSHNKDFATITDVLMSVMHKNENVELFLVGPLDIENKLHEFGARIKQFPFVKRAKHFANVASVDINIAPLEIGNPFCESKSELKFFEAGIVGVPTVASATQPFFEAIEDGVDGFTANDTEQWIEKLEKLINDADLRKSMGEKAREKALAQYTTTNADNEAYYEYLRSKLSK